MSAFHRTYFDFIFLNLVLFLLCYPYIGGMQTEGISDMPRFKNDTTYIVPNIGLTRRPSSSSSSSKSQSKSVKLTDINNIEDLRLKKKFMTVKA